MRDWFRDKLESFYFLVMFWAAKKVWPVVDIYCPGGDKDEDAPVKAMIFCDDEHTLSRILRGYTNPDADDPDEEPKVRTATGSSSGDTKG